MFLDLFPVRKPVFGMLHLKGDTRQEKMDRCLREEEIYRHNGLDAVIVEDYFGDSDDVRAALELLSQRKTLPIGVNVLDNWPLSWEYAKEYGAKFIQVDSVAGHLTPEDDVPYGEMIAKYMAEGGMYVIGGVRFKYKEVLSGNSEEEDLRIGMQRCHAIAVTGEGTGMDSPTQKIVDFRKVVGDDFPLVVAAGVTPETVEEKLRYADAAIVGSTFKEGGVDTGDVSPERVQAFMRKVFLFRKSL